MNMRGRKSGQFLRMCSNHRALIHAFLMWRHYWCQELPRINFLGYCEIRLGESTNFHFAYSLLDASMHSKLLLGYGFKAST